MRKFVLLMLSLLGIAVFAVADDSPQQKYITKYGRMTSRYLSSCIRNSEEVTRKVRSVKTVR